MNETSIKALKIMREGHVTILPMVSNFFRKTGMVTTSEELSMTKIEKKHL
jgi:hypothetical protein